MGMATCKQTPCLCGACKSDLDEALKALRDLHDEQNGPPLERRRGQWEKAFAEAGRVLKKHGA